MHAKGAPESLRGGRRWGRTKKPFHPLLLPGSEKKQDGISPPPPSVGAADRSGAGLSIGRRRGGGGGGRESPGFGGGSSG